MKPNRERLIWIGVLILVLAYTWLRQPTDLERAEEMMTNAQTKGAAGYWYEEVKRLKRR